MVVVLFFFLISIHVTNQQTNNARYGITMAVERYSNGTDVERLLPPLLLVFLNAFLPVLFEFLAIYEQWRTELFIIQLSVARAVVVRYVGLCVFFYVQVFNNTIL